MIAAGGRKAAYDDFCTATTAPAEGERIFLLVAAEGGVAAPPGEDAAWAHVAARPGDGWKRPPARHDDHLHLMVQLMESWLLADREALAAYYGAGFNPAALPAKDRPPESVPKADVVPALDRAAPATKRQGYGKGRDSFALLAEIDPALLCAASPWAERFFATLAAALR